MILAFTPNPSLDKVTLVPGFWAGKAFHARESYWFAGGKGFHLCRGLRSLSERAVIVAPLGGYIGMLVNQLAEAGGIAGSYTWISGETRTGLVIVNPLSGEITEIYEPGPELSEDDWGQLVERAAGYFDAAPVEEGFLAVSGSFPRCPPGCDLSDLVRRATGKGMRVLLDTSGAHLEAALEAGPYLVKINQLEAGELVGRVVSSPSDALAAAHQIRTRGAQAAVITLGADGAVGVDEQGRGFGWAAPAVEGIFPVGSGDSFFAGTAAGLARGLTLAQAVCLGVAAGTANALQIGPGVFDAADVDRLLPEVKPFQPD